MSPQVGLGPAVAALLAAFSTAIFVLLHRRTRSLPAGHPPIVRLLWPIAAVAASGFFIAVFPIRIPGPPAGHRLEITATGRKNPAARASEVWVQGVARADGSQVPISEFKRLGDWEVRDGVPISHRAQPATLRRAGSIDDLEIRFLSHPWSGIVNVVCDGDTQTVDLYADAESKTITVFVMASTAGSRGSGVYRFAMLIASLAAFAIPLYVVSLWLAGRPPRIALQPAGRRLWLRYSLPQAGIWTLYLLAFWPGAMSADSLDQWGQALRGHFIDWHPAFHTMLLWLVTRIWSVPAAVALVHIAALSLIAGRALTLLRRAGVPSLACDLACWLSALSPVNGMMAVTLWKDVSYSIAVLALTVSVLHIVSTNGECLRRRSAWLALGIGAALTALIRFNGPPVAFGTLAILPVCFPRRAKPLLASLALALGIFLGVRGPLYRAVGVERSPGISYQPLLFHIAAHLAAGTPLEEGEQGFVDSLRSPQDGWPFSCYAISPIMFDGRLNSARFNQSGPRMARLAWDLFRRDPVVDIDLVRCSSSLVWRVTHPPNSYYYAAHLAMEKDGRVRAIDPNEFGLVTTPKIPRPARELARGILRSEEVSWSWLVWRPAPYLYLGLLGVFAIAVRLRSWHYILAAVPIGLHSLALGLALLAQDFRYQYAAYLFGMLLGVPCLAWLLIDSRRPPRDSSSPTARPPKISPPR